MSRSNYNKFGFECCDEALTSHLTPSSESEAWQGNRHQKSTQFMNATRAILAISLVGICTGISPAGDEATRNTNPASNRVDFRWSPPEWQATICRPDDPHKSLVDKSGELVYGYCGGSSPNTSSRSDFRTRIGVVVDEKSVWKKQELLNPRVPIIRTYRDAPGLEIMEEAFGVMALPPFLRTDGTEEMKDFAQPPEGCDPSLKNIVLHRNGSLAFSLAGKQLTVALALCEGWWKEPGKRVQTLRVEGGEPMRIDTVKDIGHNKAAAFLFQGKDADGDGAISITITATGEDKNTILNGLWSFPADTKTDIPALLAGRLLVKSLIGGSNRSSTRPDLILVHITNTGTDPHTVHPKLAIELRDVPQPITYLLGKADPSGEALTIQPGKTAIIHAQHGGEPLTLEQALKERDNNIRFWESHPQLPYGSVEIPDAGIQALVDSSIRNIWQAREIKNGMNSFQVGPTCYRGLWFVDGSFILEAAAMLGAGLQARDGINYMLTFQMPDGRFEVLNGNFYKENGIVLWACYRHAQLTQDKKWLESIWPKLEGAANYIHTLRNRSLTDDSPVNDGLMPQGNPDGGQGGNLYEYTNTFWNLVGLNSFVKAARWLGKDSEADKWQKEQDDFMATFRRAAGRDMKTDPFGNRYLPNRMDGADLPQRAQWSFCHGVYPGQLFAKDDPIVMGNLAMLQATEREDMVYGTGWDANGLWNYFASFYGHAWLQQGEGRKAARALYAMANHASSVLTWREEQNLAGEPYAKVGDMPHNWASAEFIRLAIHLLALDRGNELHLLEGMPDVWLKPGMVTRLNQIATPFGPLTMELKVNADGSMAKLRVSPLDATACSKIIVHFPGSAGAGKPSLELRPSIQNETEIPLK